MQMQVGNNNSTSFTGMTPKHLKRFIPELSLESAEKLSARLDKQLPNDEFQITEKQGNRLTHLMKLPGGFNLPVGEVIYSGPNTKAAKLNFLDALIQKVQSSTLYK